MTGSGVGAGRTTLGVGSGSLICGVGATRSMRALSVGVLRVGAVTTGGASVATGGANVGGSRSTVYSRNNRPRDQLASTRNVRNGSVIAVGERISIT